MSIQTILLIKTGFLNILWKKILETIKKIQQFMDIKRQIVTTDQWQFLPLREPFIVKKRNRQTVAWNHHILIGLFLCVWKINHKKSDKSKNKSKDCSFTHLTFPILGYIISFSFLYFYLPLLDCSVEIFKSFFFKGLLAL